MTWENKIIEHGVKPADQFQANPLNFRTHPQRQRKAMKASLDDNGWVAPVIENRRTGHLLDGHERVWQALQNDNAEVPYVLVDIAEEDEGKVIASLDPIAALAEVDKDKLDEVLHGIETDNADLMAFLSDLAEDNGLYFGEQEELEDPGADIDKADELREKWGVESGQLWKLGEHRVICGDCTDKAVVERLMGGERADMVFTDPPYNVASESRNYAADKSKAMRELENSEWDKDFDISVLFPVLDFVMAKDCAVYICTSQWLVQEIWEWMWSWSDFCFYCVWCKPNPMPSLSKRHWTWATELIPYAVRGKHVSNFPNGEHALNWWNIPKAKETGHPTEKVLEVPERAILFSSNFSSLVFDGFLGSGTTLIACERLSRKCYGVEIEPKYVAVTLERWHQMTGEMPELVD